MYDLIIKNGLVIDGTGGLSFQADVAVQDGFICAVGALKDAVAAQVIDAAGKVVTPGFIDSHNHADLLAARFPDMENLTVQGVTTVCTGNCGLSSAPIPNYYMSTMGDREALEKIIPPLMTEQIPQFSATVLPVDQVREAFRSAYDVALDWSGWKEYIQHLERTGIGANMMGLVGHGVLRAQILGSDCLRAATEEEIDRMCAMLRQCMEEGACGLSYGFDYVPSSYAEEDELLRLAAVTAEYDGLVSAHIQHSPFRHGKMNREFQPYQGFREFLEIGLKTGAHLQVSHLRTPFKPLADQYAASAAANCLLTMFEEYRRKGVRVTWDVLPNYPVAGEYAPMLATKLQCYVEKCGSLTRFQEMLNNEQYTARLRAELVNRDNLGKDQMYGFDIQTPDWDLMWEVTAHTNTAYVGKTIRELAGEAGREPLDMMLELLRSDVRTCGRLVVAQKDYIGFSEFVNHPDASIGLDTECCNYDCCMESRPDMPPVYMGSYSDFSGMVWLIKHPDVCVSREKLIASMTGRTAKNLGLRDRGLVREGMRADLLVIDWERLDANIDYIHPNRAPKGIDYVFVNGVLTAEQGKPLNPRAGMVISNLTQRMP